MASPDRPALTQGQVLWLVAAGVASIAPLAPHVPVWLPATAAILLAWRAWLAHHRPLPSKWWLAVLVAAGCAGVVGQYGTLFGQNPGIALLILFFGLKLLEAKGARDGQAIVLLALFLAMAQFFYVQTIPAALASGLAVLVTVAALLALADPRSPAPALVRRAGSLLFQSLPLMLILFLLFPRVPGPLWGLPKDAHAGLTGLSETMAPGSIGLLSRSDAIAFRVRFEGAVPERHQLYWRGPVLTEFDGRVWRVAPEKPLPTLAYATAEAPGLGHEVTIEPHGKHWLFALELPVTLPPEALASRDYQLFARSPVIARQRYSVTSLPGMRVGAADPPREQPLTLPDGSNPRSRALAAACGPRPRADPAILRLAQAFFQRQSLTYTLTPPLLGEHTADEFLFDTRQGFCEHFASAFTFAMRAAGVPARVVTGYQGGEINPVDGWLTVRQSDAHAWTEVWLVNEGWVRVDPTAISAPARIEMNLAAAVPVGDPLPLLARPELAWLRDLRFRWDAVANAWNQWVIGYDPERQRRLLERLGMPQPDWRRMTAALAALCAIAVAGLAGWMLRRRRGRDPALEAWNRLSRRLARRGLARLPHEGPMDYAERVAAALPAAATEIRGIAAEYARLRYGNGMKDAASSTKRLRRRVACFRP